MNFLLFDIMQTKENIFHNYQVVMFVFIHHINHESVYVNVICFSVQYVLETRKIQIAVQYVDGDLNISNYLKLINTYQKTEYQPALKYKRHEIQCQQRKELLNVQQTMQRQIQVSFLSQIEQLQKIQRKPLILSEIELNELSQTLYTCNMCFQEFDGIIIQSHFQVCIEQKVSCEMENCQWIGIRKNFTQHLKSCSQNQIIKNNKEINQLELANFILSRNQFLNSSEGQTIDRKIIILLHMNQDTEIPMETPQRNSFLHLLQFVLFNLLQFLINIIQNKIM
ncbi:hypothetical protein pb186bvf_020276 [Paramecium bursaria]